MGNAGWGHLLGIFVGTPQPSPKGESDPSTMHVSGTPPPAVALPGGERPVRILCLNHRDPFHPAAGGAERYLWETLSRLDPSRYDVTWRCESVRGRPSTERMGSIRILRRGGRLSLHLIAPFVAGGYDLVIESVAHAVPFHTGWSHRGPRLIILYHVHQSILGREVPPGVATVVRALERTVRFEKGLFVAISNATRDEARVQLRIHDPIEVNPPGVDLRFFTPGPVPVSPPDFVVIGRLQPYKRIDRVIAAFARFPAPGTLTIVGDGEDRARLERLASGVKGVRFVGAVSEEEKRRLLQEATANVIASQAEGFGLTVLEAGAVGTPTVAVDLPVFRELIRDRASGVLVPQDDASALADALRWVCDHPELREGARTVAVQYPWDATAQRFVGLVERALGTVA